MMTTEKGVYLDGCEMMIWEICATFWGKGEGKYGGREVWR